MATGPQVPPAPSTFFHPLLQLCERPKCFFVDDSASANCGLLLQVAGSKPPLSSSKCSIDAGCASCGAASSHIQYVDICMRLVGP